MGYIEVHGADVSGGRIDKLKVRIPRVPPRVIDRDTVVKWMKDGHSFHPVVGGQRLHALQLVEVGDDAAPFVRHDNEKVAEDALPELPGVA